MTLELDLIKPESEYHINKVNLGRTIGYVRKMLGYSQKQIKEETGLTACYLSLLEHGHRGVGFDTLNEICDVMDFPAYLVISIATYPIGKAKKHIKNFK